ncbi:aromatic amino acid transaminase [Hyphococcus luteus]|uniref:aromatic amino acid transaminase n=1 Tax=Hyphococcus luteus TaxID=2058213 RepID=UPI0013FE4E06|nr:aromatic amino acid transaminase [Marinicaulis flavus]
MAVFDRLEQLPDDPILGLNELISSDPRSEKLNLGVGVYVNDDGITPVMEAVRLAERRIHEEQVSKAYLSPRGRAEFINPLGERIFSNDLWIRRRDRIAGLQTAGCVAALRLGAEVLGASGIREIWVSEPTWPIHAPIFEAAGLKVRRYPYYKTGETGVLWDDMIAKLSGIGPSDAVLLHGCCHNPSGSDLSLEQWRMLSDHLKKRGSIPFIDVAYAGLGEALDNDLAGLRLLTELVDEAVVAVSCSKSFGLYRERTGALYFSGGSKRNVSAALSNALNLARTSYSMPPDHGGAVVAKILSDHELEALWRAELKRMCEKLNGCRAQLAELAEENGLNWGFIREQKGMFSLLPITPAQTKKLREEHAIYMPSNGRINIAGLSNAGCRHLIHSVVAITD